MGCPSQKQVEVLSSEGTVEPVISVVTPPAGPELQVWKKRSAEAEGAHGVAQDLNVDPAGLLTAAASSEEVAATLGATAPAAGAGGGQETHAAVSALDAAIAAARGSQSGRVAQQAADMQSASSNYRGTDERAADNLAETM